MKEIESRTTPWNTLPRRAGARSPLESIFGEAVSLPFTAAQIEHLRAHVARSVPPLPNQQLDAFLGAMMDSPEIVCAYFCPTRVLLAASNRPLAQLVLPFDFALEAARKAAGMPSLLPQERALAWLGGFAYPVGHFYNADTARAAFAVTPAPTAERLAGARQMLLEEPLRLLRKRHAALANTLGAALHLCVDDSQCDQQQVARLTSAIRLAALRIDELWKQVGDAVEV